MATGQMCRILPCRLHLLPTLLTYITEACQGRVQPFGEGALAGEEAPGPVRHQRDHHRGHLGEEKGN